MSPSEHNARLITLSARSHHYGSPGHYTLQQSGYPAGATQMRQLLSKVHYGVGILTYFPFDSFD